MKGPCCIEDARKGVLCEKCEAKLAEGKLTALDFEVLKAIVKLDQTIIFADLEIHKTSEVEDLLLIYCKGNIGALIGREGKNIKELSNKLGIENKPKRIKIVENTGDERKTIQNILGKGVRIIAITKTYSPNSEKTCKVMVSKNDKNQLWTPKESLESIINDILGTKIELAFT